MTEDAALIGSVLITLALLGAVKLGELLADLVTDIESVVMRWLERRYGEADDE